MSKRIAPTLQAWLRVIAKAKPEKLKRGEVSVILPIQSMQAELRALLAVVRAADDLRRGHRLWLGGPLAKALGRLSPAKPRPTRTAKQRRKRT